MGTLLVLILAFTASALAQDKNVRIGDFKHAVRLTVSPQGALYIIDEDVNEISAFSEKGKLIGVVGGFGWGPSGFDRPMGLSTDGLNLLVADFGNHRIQRYDRTLSYIGTLSTHDTSYLDARFGYPRGCALSRIGDLFIIDGENRRIVKFDQFGQFERSFGAIETATGALREPRKIIVTPDDKVLVLDKSSILAYDYFGTYLGKLSFGDTVNVVSFFADAEQIVCLGSKTVLRFSPSFTLTGTLLLADLLALEFLGTPEDIHVAGNSWYILTSRTCYVVQAPAGPD